MADNYLEKKYEEYKSRKEGRTNHPYNGRKTTVIHKTRRVFVTGGAEGIGKAIVRAFRSAGQAPSLLSAFLMTPALSGPFPPESHQPLH